MISFLDGSVFRLCVPIGRALHWLTGMSTASIGGALFSATYLVEIAHDIAVHDSVLLIAFRILVLAMYAFFFTQLDRQETTTDVLSGWFGVMIFIRRTWNLLLPVYFLFDINSRFDMLTVIPETIGINISTMLWPRSKSAVRRAIEGLMKSPRLQHS